MAKYSNRTIVRKWLLFTAFLVFVMVAVGGLTRLTRSGLSIVEWKPVAGILPPLSDEQWRQEFEKYQRFPQYQQVNEGMQLDEFKYIFYWEYGHRLLGRLIGLIFALPFILFVWRRQIQGRLAVKLTLLLILGGAQGALGWFMVKSGLVDQPNVSHFRLAAHLLLALLLMCLLYWLAMDLRAPLRRRLTGSYLPTLSLGFLALVILQIFYGALTAGLHAGHIYNSFPTMNGEWIPRGMAATALDFLENPVAVQFVHRCLGWLVLISAVLFSSFGLRQPRLTLRQSLSLWSLLGMSSLQFTLGVLTLLHRVPVALGSLHQIGACMTLLFAVHAVHALREGDNPLHMIMGSRL